MGRILIRSTLVDHGCADRKLGVHLLIYHYLAGHDPAILLIILLDITLKLSMCLLVRTCTSSYLGSVDYELGE